ncbi:MAG: DUF6867 family protein [Alphaproteobacteria bacterium]
MDSILGSPLAVFIGVTVAIFGGASFMMGQALGANWRPAWQVVVYAFMLGVADRFFHNALFGGDMTSIHAYLVDAAVLVGIGLFAYRVTRVHRMVTQYPWLYAREGLFSWRNKG